MTTAASPGQFSVEVRLLPDPCLWCWEIRDAARRLVDGSWASEWTAYPSPEEAYAAGRRRLLASARAVRTEPRSPEAA